MVDEWWHLWQMNGGSMVDATMVASMVDAMMASMVDEWWLYGR